MRYVLFLTVLLPHMALALHLSPMERELVISKSRPTEEIRLYLQNMETESKSYKIEILKRREDESGVEHRSKTSELKLDAGPASLSPSSLGPGETRELILRYTGSREIPSEQAYRLIVTETTGALRMKIVSSIYVRPELAKPDLQADSRVRRLAADRIQVVLQNKGTAHQRLDGYAPVLRFSETTVRLKPETLAAWDKENILSGMKRVLTLDAETPVPPDAILTFALVRR